MKRFLASMTWSTLPRKNSWGYILFAFRSLLHALFDITHNIPCQGQEPRTECDLSKRLLIDYDAFQVFFRLRELHLQSFERIDQDGRDHQIAIPLVIGGDDIPWRGYSAGLV